MVKGNKLEGRLKEIKLEEIWLLISAATGIERLPGNSAEVDNEEVSGVRRLGHDKNDALDAGKEIANVVDDNTGANDTLEAENIPDRPNKGGIITDDRGGIELKDKPKVGNMKDKPKENRLIALPFIMEITPATNIVYCVST